ncbi:MAG: ribonucleotide reductase subunit alpha [Undibacterium sp.]|uniref:ribonucleotide reductase subunit alpha n=1 Tax=Undibacterium sp. TaxID=1914977 RepID=UPI00272777FA|nr:ribonucleotide reductase subunit alpha [Undibacterium sp.]MDO8652832.1 ribonucleotide reductase subunit alpha [Undibacterium sp.]
MEISSFADLLSAAAAQPQPQRLLFMFAKAELPPGVNPAEQQQFENQQGGALAAVMCVDKLTEELSDFAHLAAESKYTGKAWDIVFVSTMAGRGGHAPSSEEASRPLDMMVESLRNGNIGQYLAFNQAGELLQFS